MDLLNTVFSALTLLIGVVQITWMIAKDVFRDRPDAKTKHYSKSKKD